MKDLEIGKILTSEQQRDAIHVAIAPVVAGERLQRGQHVGFAKDSVTEVTNHPIGSTIGIVDPFLDKPVLKGERFWMFLYPQTITSLRHDWTHPAFEKKTSPAVDQLKAASEKWLYQFASKVGVSYEDVMQAAEMLVGSNGQERFSLGFDTPHVVFEDADKAWMHYEIATGRSVKDHIKQPMFRCAC